MPGSFGIIHLLQIGIQLLDLPGDGYPSRPDKLEQTAGLKKGKQSGNLLPAAALLNNYIFRCHLKDACMVRPDEIVDHASRSSVS